MTTEEYLIKRIRDLEEEVEGLRDLVNRRKVQFVFEDKDMPKHIYKVRFNNGGIEVERENDLFVEASE